MDPLTLGIGAIGLGLQIYGGMEASHKADEAYDVQKDISRQEGLVNDQRQQAMELDSRRRNMEIFRKTQQAQAMATAAAINQGAQFGSGLQGGLAEVSNQGYFNSQGVNNNLEIGENIFGINRDISANKLKLSGIQTSMANDQGIAALGGSIFKGAGTFGNLAQGMGSFKMNVPGFNPIAGVAG
jgi:hypothetical protein